MDENNRNFFLAVILSICVVFAWQFFFAKPETHTKPPQQKTAMTPATGSAEKSKAETSQAPQPQPQPKEAKPGALTSGPSSASAPQTRAAVLKASAPDRIKIDTPSLAGSISLKGAKFDDLTLKHYHETVSKTSPNVVLLSPAGTPHAYYAEEGWVGGTGEKGLKLPGADTVWTAKSKHALTPSTPVTLTWNNGEGLTFTRVISVDKDYMFTIKDSVANAGQTAVTLYHYGLVARHETPNVSGYYILYEGLIGVADHGVSWCGTFLSSSLCQLTYKKAIKDPTKSFESKSGWLGMTDKYWATTVIPPQGKSFTARFSGANHNGRESFQTSYLQSAMTVPPSGMVQTTGHIFAGAKVVRVVDSYVKKYGITKFDLLIDWGWFYFLTKPMFFALDFFYKLVGNFGVAILLVTLSIKLILFPLATKSYVSMSKMKKLQPEMQRIKERFADDRVRQQQATMELYKKEKVNPASGCLPILVQVPVFFSLYKVLFVTIEMRHAPFFGWIKDLSAPDPTTIFNLFGLIPWTPPHFLMIGIWPLVMGFTMFMQMRLNPTPPDPVQQKVFTWMPVFFTFLLARFPAGLVIYWAWNNTLSVIQQSVIMFRQGVDIPLFENLGFKKKQPDKGGKKNAKDTAKSSSKS